MKRLWVTCLSFAAPIAVFALFASNVSLVSEAEAKKGPGKKGAGPPTVLECELADGTVDNIPIGGAGGMDDAVGACLAVGGHPVGAH